MHNLLAPEKLVASYSETEKVDVQTELLTYKTETVSPKDMVISENILAPPTDILTATAYTVTHPIRTIEFKSNIVDDGGPGCVYMGAAWWKISQSAFDDSCGHM